MHDAVECVVQSIVGILESKRAVLDGLEGDVCDSLASNNENRENLQQKLEESHREAQSLYASLMIQVLQPLSNAGTKPIAQNDGPNDSSSN